MNASTSSAEGQLGREAGSRSLLIENIAIVTMDGRLVKHVGELVGVDLPRSNDQILGARDRVFANAGVACGCPRHLTAHLEIGCAVSATRNASARTGA